eukprot:SAG22_NODE_1252_length_5005_cov_1.761313_7_plen_318_part_00
MASSSAAQRALQAEVTALRSGPAKPEYLLSISDPVPAAVVTLVTPERAAQTGWSSEKAAAGTVGPAVGAPWPDAAGNPLVWEVEARFDGPPGPYCHPHRVRLTFFDSWPAEPAFKLHFLSTIHHFQLDRSGAPHQIFEQYIRLSAEHPEAGAAAKAATAAAGGGGGSEPAFEGGADDIDDGGTGSGGGEGAAKYTIRGLLDGLTLFLQGPFHPCEHCDAAYKQVGHENHLRYSSIEGYEARGYKHPALFRLGDPAVRQRSSLLKAVITAFLSVSLPFLAVPLRSHRPVAIRASRMQSRSGGSPPRCWPPAKPQTPLH